MLPDGTRNGVRLQRLKDKLGNKSNASAEIEYDDAVAWLVGEEGRGVPTIIEMVNMTRLDCVIAAAARLRLRRQPGRVPRRAPAGVRPSLADQPAMANVLADLAVGVRGGHHASCCGWPGRPTGPPAATSRRPRSGGSRWP